MIIWENINSKNFKNLIYLCKNLKKFNSLNEDVLAEYKKSNFFKKLFMKNKIKFLKEDESYLGFIWVNSFNKYECKIRALYICDEIDDKINFNCNLLNKIFLYDSKVIYECENSYRSSNLLNKLSFINYNTVYQMNYELNNFDINNYNNNKLIVAHTCDEKIIFETLNEFKDEGLRCRIQNEIFNCEDRIPLSKEDIYFDEQQDYYIKRGCFFIKKEEVYIGYGQIIKEDNLLTIVNFGIIDAFRGLGYAKCFLNYIIRQIKILFPKEEKIFIKVNQHNIRAVNLYKAIGFKPYKTISTWQLQRNKG